MSNTLVFAVNGKKQEVVNPDPGLTLANYLRQNGYTGTKIGCGEGGCGACTVNLSYWGPTADLPSKGDNKVQYRSANSCLVPVCAIDGYAVTTIEGLGNTEKIHPLQERIANHNGSQCGYCTPGMVMAMYNMTKKHPDQCCDKKSLEGAIDGNLCRCTGYRPILDAFKSIADDKYDMAATDPAFPEFLKTYTSSEKKFANDNKEWISPTSIQGVFAALEEAGAAADRPVVSVVAGHTAKGIYKASCGAQTWWKRVVLVNVSNVPELKRRFNATSDGIEVGAAATVDDFIQVMTQVGAGQGGVPGKDMYPNLAEHAARVAGTNVRGWGSIGGNLLITKRFAFQSDLATALCGAGAHVTVASKDGEQRMPLEDFLGTNYQFPKIGVLKNVFLPYRQGDGWTVRSYKVGKRPVDSHAVVNAAFEVKQGGGKIEQARLVFGCFLSGSGGNLGGPRRAVNTEKVVMGRTADDATMQAALEALQQEAWWPTDDYEAHLARGFLFKLFAELQGKTEECPKRIAQNGDRPVTKASQQVDWYKTTTAPIHVGMTKTNAKAQACGQTTYVGDMPAPAGCLYAAYTPVAKANATVEKIDTSNALKLPGVERVITADTLPAGNCYDPLLGPAGAKLLVPVGGTSDYAGQPCACVLADNPLRAALAAKAVSVTLKKDGAKPLMTQEQCLAEGAPEGSNMPLSEAKRGDPDEALKTAKKAIKGTVVAGVQKHVYMEPTAAMAVMTDEGVMEVWATAQVASFVHNSAQGATGMAKNKIVAKIPAAVGGGFGGKISRQLHLPAIVSAACKLTNKPVKYVLDRNSDITMNGGRHGYVYSYDVGFDPTTGKIEALKAQIDVDAGMSKHDPLANFAADVATRTVEQCYDIPHYQVNSRMCYTHKTAGTPMRGPGEIQSSVCIETIMDHIAAESGLSAQQVREANLFPNPEAQAAAAANPTAPDVEKYSAQWVGAAQGKMVGSGEDTTPNPIGGMWEHLKKTADYEKRKAAVDEFNATHKWRKRGIAMTNVRYRVGIRGQEVCLNLYGDGTVLITTDGSEIGQGLHTKVIQYASYHLSQICDDEVPMSDIRCGPLSTDKISFGNITGGSTTSEGCCAAIQDAIEKAAEKLKPTLETLKAGKKEGEKVTYKELVGMGGACTVGALQFTGVCTHLGANEGWFGGPRAGYCIFGAACSEVEVDVITGETTINYTRIVYDCGQSLNPTIDLGQCEGGFMQGVGFCLREKVVENGDTGELLTDGTWEYKIPCSQDVPLDFQVEFFPKPYMKGIASSKASGEPPLVLGVSAFSAVREAVKAARKDMGKDPMFRLDSPADSRAIALAIGANVTN